MIFFLDRWGNDVHLFLKIIFFLGKMNAYGVFIWATGRSGSTTVLEMLNLVPCVSLSGENGEFVKHIDDLSSYMNNTLNHRTGAWYNEIDKSR